jgi:predicted house-cleaning NTP pyrophosphatase (Maf/HAM1 superfamily)
LDRVVQGRWRERGRELAREHVLNIAQSKYKQSAAMYPNRIVMLCDRATVLARSDRNPPYTAMRLAG